MKKSALLKIVSVLVSVIGFYLLIKSPTLGDDAASEYLRVVMFGSMDTAGFQIMKQSFIDAYRLAGAIMLGVGSFYAFRFFSKSDE
ncbi:hypothetical protein [Brevibacillus reuszeri]|uniref:hypothetical protein n=1 Tax=Brevibacillus reuszeri TaxID=54915 RepID=UPI000CCC0912|nr:hypothetical protein [Brevibacillus reuszeri]